MSSFPRPSSDPAISERYLKTDCPKRKTKQEPTQTYYSYKSSEWTIPKIIFDVLFEKEPSLPHPLPFPFQDIFDSAKFDTPFNLLLHRHFSNHLYHFNSPFLYFQEYTEVYYVMASRT